MQKINWGIIGCGKIAEYFAADLALTKNAKLEAVAAREPERARDFAERHSAAKHYGSYAEICADPNVDVIYLATLHAFHWEQGLAVLQSGKHLFCEKPLTLNAAQAQELYETAQKHGCFIAEAFWTAYFPAITPLAEFLRSRRLGALYSYDAAFCSKVPHLTEERWLNRQLGGGALLDIGVYPLAFYMHLMGGMPSSLSSLAYICDTGVDEECTALLQFGEACLARFTASFRHSAPHEAHFHFELGSVLVRDFFHPSGFEVRPCAGLGAKPKKQLCDYLAKWREKQGNKQSKEPDQSDEPSPFRMDFPFVGQGYCHQAEAVSADILQGRKTSFVYPIEQSVRVMQVLDALRKPWGLHYPCEEAN